ncbi:hypothetical protein R4P64_24110 [Rhodococcus sp. IEGM 1366]|uniref:lipopolysaccharide biosynthesis protein n=1 Tax=Rhodococcus sp. IEGM 1366 TaxID=3082223 RepID=UPI0029548F16|nr:hypothetical protein [Rhodococcus sp. IEGM 1366]MDV8069618.1 hypothetical protein [Rhodococcus sp. IEGM 1366]
MSAKYGSGGWATVAIAQSVGATGALIAELGWGVTGPQRVPRLSAVDKSILYRQSVSSRATVVAFAVLPVSVITWLLCDFSRISAIVISLGSLCLAFSPAWFFIGDGKPGQLLAYESLPRLVFVGIAALLIHYDFPIGWYGGALIVGSVTALSLSAICSHLGFFHWKQNWRTIRSQKEVVLGRAISGSFTSFAPALVGLVNPLAVPVFAAVDRLMRMALAILAGIPNRLQSWLGAATGRDRHLRSLMSIRYNCYLGLVSGLIFGLLAPTFVTVLFAGQVSFGYELSALSGFLLFLICTSRGFGLAMVAAGRAKHITISVLCAAGVGVPLLCVLGLYFGAVGALAGQILAETVGIVIQSRILSMKWKSNRQWSTYAASVLQS